MKRLFLIAAFCLALAASFAACGASETEQSALRIDTAALGAEPTFIDHTQDGVAMQLIAIKDADNTVRLAINTCQSCGGSPYAWFEYIGDDTLQCQNCGLTFRTETVGTTKAAGCNPVTITDFAVDGDSVTIPGSVLSSAKELFKNWKAFG
ncbi:MAG: DUF2318 domain-containing protein [Ruminococcaceae bacterium]|nr:DUF2318 domain-containing protein [Oscillospiraceae bacterium]